jgi:amidase
MDDLVKLTAREAVARLRRRELSPLDLIEAAAARIAAVEPAVNALPTLCLDRARAHARRLMAAAPAEPPPGYLFGLPIAVKDLNEVAGVRTTYGSPLYADHVPERSDLVVERLEGNGAVVLAKSNAPEFGAGANTFNEVFGVTRNPWDTRLTCGGSSGGSAVALATGEVWLATGSDLGGSLRIPASSCSATGLRPSPGRVASGPGALPFGTLSVQGPMARNIGDLALMLDAQCGGHASDPRALPAPEQPFQGAAEAASPPARVAYSPDLGVASVDPEVERVCAQAAAAFAELGATVEEACPDLSGAVELFGVLRAAQYAAGMAPLLESHRGALKPEIVWNIERGLALSADDIGRAERARGALYHRVVAFFDDYDLLLSPAVVVPPFEAETRYLTEAAGASFESYVDWLVLTFAITLTACPALSLPCGFTAAGLPVGLQMVAPPRGEAALLAAAAALEARLGLHAALPIDPKTPA